MTLTNMYRVVWVKCCDILAIYIHLTMLQQVKEKMDGLIPASKYLSNPARGSLDLTWAEVVHGWWVPLMYDDTVECRCYGQLLLHPCHVSNNTSEPQGGNEGLSINLTIYHHHPHKTTMHLSSVTKPQNRWTYIHLNPARRSSKLTWVGMVHGYWVPLMHNDT